MPPFAQMTLCSECHTLDITPGKRKCRRHRISKDTRPRVRKPAHSTTRRAFQERDLNTSSTRVQVPQDTQLKTKTWFGSSIYEPEPTPPSRYQDNEENGITPAGYQLSSELQKAFHDNAPKRQKTTAIQFQREARKSPILNRLRLRDSTTFQDNSTLSSSPSHFSSGLPSSQINTIRPQQTARVLFNSPTSSTEDLLRPFKKQRINRDLAQNSLQPSWSPQDIPQPQPSNTQYISNHTPLETLLNRFQGPRPPPKQPYHHSQHESEPSTQDSFNQSSNQSSLPSISQIQRQLQQDLPSDSEHTTPTTHLSPSSSPSFRPSVLLSQSSIHVNQRRPIPRQEPVDLDDLDEESYPILTVEPSGWISRFSAQVQAHDLGPMTVECSFCRALHFSAEAAKNGRGNIGNRLLFEGCCKKGSIHTEAPLEYPQYLIDLFTGRHPHSRHFLANTRQFNALLAYCSVEMNANARMQNTPGLRTFQLQGTIHHVSGSNHPQPGNQPSYAQLYFLSIEDATSIRCNRNPNLNSEVLRLLTHQYHLHNGYSTKLRRASEAMDQVASQHPADRVTLDRQFRLQLEAGRNKNRENLPSTFEVAAILPVMVERNWDPDREEIVLATREPPAPGQSGLRRISRRHPAYHPLAYPLFFPLGGPMYREDVVLDLANRIRRAPCAEPRQFLFERVGIFSLILRGRLLFQQFLCDLQMCIEQDRLAWNRCNQKLIRRDKYVNINQGLNESIEPNRIGQRTILPRSFVGSPRYMEQGYQDALALVGKFGKPDLFITFTANPNWPEIQNNLFKDEGQSASDRPDLTVRVTRLKFQAFLQEIKSGLFGPVAAYVYTVEYQKRGLPHFHLLLFLDHKAPSYEGFFSPGYVDNIILAELPPPEIDPDGSLTKIVKGCMLHRKCGQEDPSAPCTRNNHCEKGFPKPYQETTYTETNGYPLYRRRQDTPYIMDGQQHLSNDLNRRVIPYNPYLTRRYNCHINIESVCSVKAIRYIFKYIHKGSDLTTLTIHESHQNPQNLQNDEITRWEGSRYMGPNEALWRQFEFPVREQHPPVKALSVHLPGENPVSWEDHMTSQDLRDKTNNQDSTLMGFFRWNMNESITAGNQGQPYIRDQQQLYINFPETHVWLPKPAKWQARKRGEAIGRIHHCSPQEGERWYLRRLLLVVRGPTSYEDLRTVDEVVYPTFQAACIALGLVEGDSEWVECFQEAINYRTGAALRDLFIVALIFNRPADPLALWERFREWICDDLPRRIERERARGLLSAIPVDSPNLNHDLGLYELRKRLKEYGKDLPEFELPLPVQQWEQLLGNPLIARELDYNHEDEQHAIDELRPQLNEDQRVAFDAITTRIETNPSNCCFFIQGPAGTGKTFLYRVLCHYLRAKEKIVLCVASSGIAALLLPGGTTAHSRFKIPLKITPTSTCSIPATSQTAALLRQTSLIVWDEAPMTHRHCYEAMDRTLRDICELPETLFGGIPLVFGGDFAQILPVISGGNRTLTVDASIQRSAFWETCTVFRLTRNMRLQQGIDNQAFAEWIRTMSYKNETRGLIQLPPYISRCSTEDDLISKLYPQFPTGINEQLDFFRDRVLLAVHNAVIQSLNDQVLERFLQAHPDLAPRRYFAIDTLHTDEQGHNIGVSEEMMHGQTPDGLPPFELRLRPGIPVMLLRNLNPAKGLANGSRMVLTRVHPRILEGRLLGGEFHGQYCLIPRVKLDTDPDHFPRFSRKQFPIKICYAMTIHKSQGQSLKRVGVDLRRPCFTHGQLYVALSRVTDVSRLDVLFNDGSNDQTDNVVYPEALLED